MAKEYSQAIANAIHAFLTEDDWHFAFDEEKGIFKFNLTLKSKIRKVEYFIRVASNDYTVYTVSSISADEDDPKMMATMAEFVCRANYGLRDGNFELDMRDGEIRYKSYVNCKNYMPSQDVIRDSIYCPAAMFKNYGDGIVEIIFNEMSAKDAVDMCEK